MIDLKFWPVDHPIQHSRSQASRKTFTDDFDDAKIDTMYWNQWGLGANPLPWTPVAFHAQSNANPGDLTGIQFTRMVSRNALVIHCTLCAVGGGVGIMMSPSKTYTMVSGDIDQDYVRWFYAAGTLYLQYMHSGVKTTVGLWVTGLQTITMEHGFTSQNTVNIWADAAIRITTNAISFLPEMLWVSTLANGGGSQLDNFTMLNNYYGGTESGYW